MWTIKDYQEVYARYEASGLTANDFCMNEGITRSRFYYWQKRYLKMPKKEIEIKKKSADAYKVKNNSGFIPVLLSGVEAVKSYPLSTHTAKASPSVSGLYMEISYASGASVRLMGEKDMELVKTLIQLTR